MTLHQLVKNVENLFSVPEVYFRVKKMVDLPATTVADIAKVISEEPGLAARVLKIANSAFFGFATKIETLDRAINIMGLAHLQNILLVVSVSKSFKGVRSELIDIKKFWMHSIYCAVIARILARRCKILDDERLFVCGILHDIGHLVIYSALPSHATEVIFRAHSEQRPLYLVEKEMYGFDYAEVGGELLKQWLLPESLYLVVRQHIHFPLVQQYQLDSAIINLANSIALRKEQQETGLFVKEIDLLALQLVGITEAELDEVKVEAEANMLEILNALFGI